ncbi:MAG TPA: alkaline phosphatase family protein [Acidimicrobiales bacterium]|nr:alkaline phosphatase family protein [Acidimicrobiales bacterium]
MDEPVIPDYGGACIAGLVPAIFACLDGSRAPSWLPHELAGARQVVLMVVDGLGWEQLQERGSSAPFLSSLPGRPIDSVVPSTTPVALTSITTGTPPGRHGVTGVVVRHSTTTLNTLRWTVDGADARQMVDPMAFQPVTPFCGRAGVPVVTKAMFEGSGLTTAHLRTSRQVGWELPSGIPVEVGRLLDEGARFVYAYYDGVDHAAHRYGLGEHYEAELASADRLVAAIADALPAGAALAVTADHGQVEVVRPEVGIDAALLDVVDVVSGESRLRWLHAKAGCRDELIAGAKELFSDVAWVRSAEEAIAERWFGPDVAPWFTERIGDVAIAAKGVLAVGGGGPHDVERQLVSLHGSLTPAEMRVPLLIASA